MEVWIKVHVTAKSDFDLTQIFTALTANSIGMMNLNLHTPEQKI